MSKSDEIRRIENINRFKQELSSFQYGSRIGNVRLKRII